MKVLGKKITLVNTLYGFLVLCIGTIIGYYIQKIVKKTDESIQFEPFEPYIAIVLSNKGGESAISDDFLIGFESEMNFASYFKSNSKQKIKYKIFYDLGSETVTTRIANQLISDNNCILVIINSNNTLMEITSDIFSNSKDPISYIITRAINNDLNTRTKFTKIDAVLRMLPNSEQQAEQIGNLAFTITNNTNVAIYSDHEDESYSLNLVRDITENIRKSGGKILIEELINSANSFNKSSNIWKRQKNYPEIIIYVGSAYYGMHIIDQISKLHISVPVVFTDRCMNRTFASYISENLSNRAFFVSPMILKEENLLMPTYEHIGKDACILAKTILMNCNKCTRKEIREYIIHEKEYYILEELIIDIILILLVTIFQ